MCKIFNTLYRNYDKGSKLITNTKTSRTALHKKILQHQAKLRQCERCPAMIRPVIVSDPVLASILLVGQAPGLHEAKVGKPFGWTAGKTLFQWFSQIGLNETQFREQVYMAAVCRCFPGKQPNKNGKRGGDRVPSEQEIAHCRPWLDKELKLLKPQLLLAVGKLAISQFMPVERLVDVVGQTRKLILEDHQLDIIALPHPSGLSTWHRMEPGKTLLQEALALIAAHPAWQAALNDYR